MQLMLGARQRGIYASEGQRARAGVDRIDLDSFVPAYVESYAELLRRHAPLLRMTMERASFDPLVSGQANDLRAEADATEAFLRHSAQCSGSDHSVKAQSGEADVVIGSPPPTRLSLPERLTWPEKLAWMACAVLAAIHSRREGSV